MFKICPCYEFHVCEKSSFIFIPLFLFFCFIETKTHYLLHISWILVCARQAWLQTCHLLIHPPKYQDYRYPHHYYPPLSLTVWISMDKGNSVPSMKAVTNKNLFPNPHSFCFTAKHILLLSSLNFILL